MRQAVLFFHFGLGASRESLVGPRSMYRVNGLSRSTREYATCDLL